MDIRGTEHSATVISTDGRLAVVSIDLGNVEEQCGGCSLYGICRKDNGDKNKKSQRVEVTAEVLPDLSREISDGSRVRVEATSCSTTRATIWLLVVPLLSLLLTAVCGTYAGLDEGFVAVLTIIIPLAVFALVHLLHKKGSHKVCWKIFFVEN